MTKKLSPAELEQIAERIAKFSAPGVHGPAGTEKARAGKTLFAQIAGRSEEQAMKLNGWVRLGIVASVV
jgi:hypothetical protein